MGKNSIRLRSSRTSIFDFDIETVDIYYNCQDFISNKNRPKFVFGTNAYAKSVAKIIDFDGFIDEFSVNDTFWGKPVFRNLRIIPKNALILSCIVGNKPISTMKMINNYGIEAIDYFSFLKYSGLPLKDIEFWEGFKRDYLTNETEYNSLSLSLADSLSQHILQNIINFRLSYSLSYMDGFVGIQHEQYFEDIVNLQQYGEVFIDAGGYDGHTSKEFIKRCPNFKKIFFFEPQTKYCMIAKEKLSNLNKFNNIEFFEMGLSIKKGKQKFNDKLECASKVSKSGTIIINLDSIDNIIIDPVTYIKMDIEGSESMAIEGAKKTILCNHPKLAICVYHKANDLITIPKQILSIRSDYNIYIRHYTEGVAETVMYFIPKPQI